MALKFRTVDGSVCAPIGFKAATVYSGIRKAERDDLTLIVSDVPAVAAGVFTTNQVHAWCIKHNRERLAVGNDQIRAIICNAGNANCCNGEIGRQNDLEIEAAISAHLRDVNPKNRAVLTASTGVIGRKLPMEKVNSALSTLCARLERSEARAKEAAAAIMTTDLVPKALALEFDVNGAPVRVGAIAKGSGMIAPNMATMLAFITTDLAISSSVLEPILRRVVAKSFNCLTVDGDTSTNDMVLVLANGASNVSSEDSHASFEEALLYICQELAKKVARDGEGATKLVTVRLLNPPQFGEKIAKTIAESPLVKTACFGNDPNWGRILVAAGYSGVQFDPQQLVIRLAGHEVFVRGEPTAFDPNQVRSAMKTEDLIIELEFLSADAGAAAREAIQCWTCDFSYDYVRINASYGT